MDPITHLVQKELFDDVTALIDGAETIAICAHTSPDGDAIGSVLALAELIERAWEGKKVTALLADSDEIPRIYQFLPGSERFVHVEDYDVDPDLFICVDLSGAGRLAEARPVMERSRSVAVMDHHPAGEKFWDVAIIRPEAAAAGVVVAQYAHRILLGPVSQSMAQNLMCALVTDTGRFQYSNTNAECFRVASSLMEAGANPAEIALNVYESSRLSYLHLSATVMSRIITFEQGRIAYSYATAADFASTGVPVSECDGLVDLVRSVEGAEVVLFLKEVPSGHVRGNLRSKTDRDVSGVAAELGGGGHVAAAGFTFEGDIDQALSAVLPKLRALYADAGASK